MVARHLERRGLSVQRDRVLIVDGAATRIGRRRHGDAQTGRRRRRRRADLPGIQGARSRRFAWNWCRCPPRTTAPIWTRSTALRGPDESARSTRCRRCTTRWGGSRRPSIATGWWRSPGEHGLLVIEDAAYAYLADDRRPRSPRWRPELTVYVSGLSKSVATGLRVGFVAAPIELVPAIERAIRATTWNTPSVMTAIACRWLDDGTVARLETQKRADARRQAGDRPRRAGGPAAHRASLVVLPVVPAARGRAGRPGRRGAARRTRIGVHRRTVRTSAHVPHAIRLALGSVRHGCPGAALGTVKRVVDAHTHL